MFKKRYYGIYFHTLFEEDEGQFVIRIQGWRKAQRTVKLYNDAVLAYGWYYMKRIKY